MHHRCLKVYRSEVSQTPLRRQSDNIYIYVVDQFVVQINQAAVQFSPVQWFLPPSPSLLTRGKKVAARLIQEVPNHLRDGGRLIDMHKVPGAVHVRHLHASRITSTSRQGGREGGRAPCLICPRAHTCGWRVCVDQRVHVRWRVRECADVCLVCMVHVRAWCTGVY